MSKIEGTLSTQRRISHLSELGALVGFAREQRFGDFTAETRRAQSWKIYRASVFTANCYGLLLT
jgi:hypothetical protein